jgi:23S rRNA pseudouridine2605 synthase
MARSGVGSRRKCEEYIAQGRVRVDGRVVKEQGTKITDEIVAFDGREIHPARKMIYLALNKPTRYLCSNADPEGRPLAIDLLRPVYTQRLFHVGRLDFLSSGLIFFTNDGNFAKKITHPSREIEKEYVVEIKQPVKEEDLIDFKRGVTVEGIRYRILSYRVVTPIKIRIVLKEGKNRELRNLFNSRRYKVKRVHRIRIGKITMKGLAPGQFRPLTDKEITSLAGGGD